MKKRVFSLMLVCVMLVSILGGCKKEATPTETKSAEPTSAPAAADADTDAEAPAATEAPALPEYSEITVEVFDRGTDAGKTDAGDNYYTKWIQDKALKELNLGVKFVKVSRWEEIAQLNNLMAAGSAPDVCMTYSGDLVAQYRDLGGLIDLAPYLDQLNELDAFLGEDTALPGRRLIERNRIMETGQIFAIPARRMNLARLGTFIRKDWLDKLGLPLPKTTEEFYNALVAFKEKDPGNVGKDNIIPFAMTSDVRWRAGALLESFVDPNLSVKDKWVNTVIDRQFLLPGYKEGVRFLNKMYNEGLVDTQFMLYLDDITHDDLVKSGVVGAFIHNWDQPYRESPGLLRDLKVNVPDAEIVAIDCFTDANGKTTKTLYDPAGLNFFIPASSKNVDGAIRYINWLSKFENRNYLQIGDEGVTHELVNGIPKVITATGDKIMNSAMNIDYTFMINGLDLGDDQKNADAIALSYAVDSQLVLDAYNYAMTNGTPQTIIPVTLSAAGPVTQTLDEKGRTFMAETITCKPADFDKVWAEQEADWRASGAQAVIDERAAKYIEP